MQWICRATALLAVVPPATWAMLPIILHQLAAGPWDGDPTGPLTACSSVC